VFVRSFGAIPGYPELTVLDTTVPATILEAERRIDLSSTLFITAGKSGASLEVVSLHDYFWERVVEAGLEPGPHFIAITDPGSALGKQAAEHRFRKTFLNPSDIGSRFSALSYFGLVPAALIGIDVERLLMRAAQSVEACGPDVPALESPGMWLGGIMGDAAPRGRNKLTVVISPPIESFGLWLEHLVAESTGKEDAGIIPITGESLGAPEVYGDDRLFVYLRLDGHDAFDRQVSALETRGFPVATQRIHTAYDLGREMFRWEFSTAIAGLLLRINPFNKPNITVSREITEKILSAFEQDGCVPEGEYIAADNPELHGMLDAFLGETPAGAYIGINAFINPTPQARDALDRLRGAWRDRFRVATTLGFGPRYLHSTGQMHKGGPPVGRFVQITMDDAEDMSIPGASYSFGILKSAQALGDYEALKQKGRPIIRIHLKNDDDFDKLLETR
jgi:hypothetical protein